MNKSESIVELSKSLVKFQSEVKQPLKDADNPFFKSKYVPLENVVEAITNCAPNQGLSFVQYPLNDEQGRVGVATILMHESGEYIEFDPVFMNAEKNTPQGAGSLITYLKRYALSAIFGITSDVDDDANESSGNQSNQPTVATLKAKWKILSGSEDGFDKWYKEQKQKKVGHSSMDAFLTRKMNEKNGKGA